MPRWGRTAGAAAWIASYLAAVTAPLAVLVLEAPAQGGGWRWDFGIALGFAGLAMLMAQFALTARFRGTVVPFGIDVVFYFHRWAAVVATALVVAHPAVLFLDNPALTFFLDPRVAPWHMTAGLVSVGALLALMATSLARRPLRVPYEGWRVAHAVLAAVVVGGALVHVFGVGYRVAAPAMRALWVAYALAWAAVVLLVRLVRPLGLRRRPYRVASVVPERGDAWTVTVAPDGHAGFRFTPGQFAWLTVRASPFAMREHPFSIASDPADAPGRLAFVVKALGDFTATIGTLREGERVYVDGPYGVFGIDRHPEAPGYVFVAGGIGIAPMLAMLRALATRGDRRPLWLFYAYRRWERMTAREELEALGPRLDLRVVWVVEEPPDVWDRERGRLTPALFDRHLPPGRAAFEYFVCGPEAMIQASEAALVSLGVPRRRIHSELFNLV
jgi:predicted ferric reductase